MSITEMRAKYRRLEATREQIDRDMLALARGLAVAGAWKGRPPKGAEIASQEARAAHRRYQHGDRDDATIEGERTYKRAHQRRLRARRRSAA